MNTAEEARLAIIKSIPYIEKECKLVLSSELHYQAMIYHCLRLYSNIPVTQLGMNVKIYIKNPKAIFLKEAIKKKNINYRQGKEIIPDVSIFSQNINCDFRRRNCKNTLRETLYSLEIKASERLKGRIRPGEVINDIIKLKAQLQEIKNKYNKVIGVGIIIIDTAPKKAERMTPQALDNVKNVANKENVDFWYIS